MPAVQAAVEQMPMPVVQQQPMETPAVAVLLQDFLALAVAAVQVESELVEREASAVMAELVSRQVLPEQALREPVAVAAVLTAVALAERLRVAAVTPEAQQVILITVHRGQQTQAAVAVVQRLPVIRESVETVEAVF